MRLHLSPCLAGLLFGFFGAGCSPIPTAYSQQTLDANLGHAILEDGPDRVKYWLSKGASANANGPKIKDSNPRMSGQPVVIEAAQMHDVEKLRILLDHGADVNAHWVAPDDCHCFSGEQILETPLVDAAAEVDVDEVKLLLERGADVRVVPGGTYGKTLLSYVRSEYTKQFNYAPGDVGGGRLPDDANVEGRYKQVAALLKAAKHNPPRPQ